MTTTLLKSPPGASRSESAKSIFEYLEDPKATGTLPSLKSVLDELESLTQKSDARLDELTRMVQGDQGMSLRVLRMANSAYYAPPSPIMDLHDAILYIGLSTFRGAVLSTRCIETTCMVEQGALDWTEFWIHAAGVGHVTMELSYHLKTTELGPESFYLMGLLHDIGKIVLAHVMPDEFNKIYLQAAEEKKAPAEVEREHLGIDHGHLGAWYLEKQGIPLALCEPVRFHHSDAQEDKSSIKYALLVRMADHLVRHFEIGQSGNCSDDSDPFKSQDWVWYLEHCHHPAISENELKENLTEQMARISDLVRNTFV